MVQLPRGKLVYYGEGGSEKHLRDTTGIIKIGGENLDIQYITRFATQPGVADIWQAVLECVTGN